MENMEEKKAQAPVMPGDVERAAADILVHLQQEHKPTTWLKIESFEELMRHEKEIVDRIEQMPNGGQLFLIHPFMLLQDIGVELSRQAQSEILKREPRLTGLSPVPYQALKYSKEKQKVRFHLRGLFERRKTS